MLAAVRSAAVLGIDAYDVLVEVDVALGLPMWVASGSGQGKSRARFRGSRVYHEAGNSVARW